METKEKPKILRLYQRATKIFRGTDTESSEFTIVEKGGPGDKVTIVPRASPLQRHHVVRPGP